METPFHRVSRVFCYGGSLAKGDETVSSGANTVDYVPSNSPDP